MEPFGGSRIRSETDADIINSFQSFLEQWMLRQQTNLEDLLLAASGSDDLIHRVLDNYHQYYQEKSRVASQNVLLLFSAPWLTSLEHAFLWVTGFRPCMAVRMATRAVGDLSEGQVAEIERLVARTRAEEKGLNDEVARVQESVAGPAMLGVARRCRIIPRDGLVGEAEDAVEVIKAGLEAVVSRADLLRAGTALKVVEILSPAQTVKFLAAATRLQLQLHRLGLERELTN